MLTISDIKMHDKSNMFDEIKNMYKQIEFSLKIINNSEECTLLKHKSSFKNKFSISGFVSS